METLAITLRPRGATSSDLSSDTLFGAICWGMKLLGLKPDLDTWLGQAEPPFAVSAVLPARLLEGRVVMRLYPRPMTFAIGPTALAHLQVELAAAANQADARMRLHQQAKGLRRVAYVTEAVLQEISVGHLTAEAVLRHPSDYVQMGGLLLTVSEAAKVGSDWRPWHSAPVQHNHVDRVAGTTVTGQLFYQEETRFAPDGGLWALVRASAEDAEQLIRPALRLLADTGLGGNRSVGHGLFDIAVETAPTLPEVPNPNGVLMLSRYLPTADEVAAIGESPLAYRLTTVRGRREQRWPGIVPGASTPPVYKRAVRMFEPGSVFPLVARREVFGRLAQVVRADEGGLVYQSGAAIPLYVRV